MIPTVHKIDSNGDTLLILLNANAPFARAPAGFLWVNALPQYTTPQMRQNELGSASEDRPQVPDSKPEVRMKLSSKHLTLASAYFQKLTANNWKETNPEDGYSYVVTTEEWNQEALLILMNIIHGRTAKVPRTVSLEMLAQISVLVDYYKCHEVVDFFAKTWIGSLAEPLPSSHGRNLLLRLTVSWVFSEDETFRALTKILIHESRGPIDSLGLPIPGDIIDALNKRREDLVSEIISGLHNLKAQFYHDGGNCTFECSSIHLGALIKGMNKIRILDPRPERPFFGYSLAAMEQAVRDIKEPIWHSICASGFMSHNKLPAAQTPPVNTPPVPITLLGGSFPTPTPSVNTSPAPVPRFSPSFTTPNKPVCSLSAKTKPIIDEQLSKMDGLDLKDFINQDKTTDCEYFF